MGFLDSVLGRRKPAAPNLDALFALPSAAVTLQVDLDMVPTGRGSVAFRAPEGRAFADVEADVRRLLDADGGIPVEIESDAFGFTWLVVATDPADVGAVVTDVHAVNTTLVEAGFGPQLLCSLCRSRSGGGPAMVYLFKRGTFTVRRDPATASVQRAGAAGARSAHRRAAGRGGGAVRCLGRSRPAARGSFQAPAAPALGSGAPAVALDAILGTPRPQRRRGSMVDGLDAWSP
jgi:hypothetical protein